MTDLWRRVTWIAGLLVATAGAVATAHGLYEVAVACGQPPAVAALYPIMTDGLALVAYAASTQLRGWPLRYAWACIIVAASLSGVVQAIQLAGGLAHVPPVGVRAAIGAWVAVSFLLSVHLTWLVKHAEDETRAHDRLVAPVAAPALAPAVVSASVSAAVSPETPPPASPGRVSPPTSGISARAHAAELARGCYRELGAWPTIASLAQQANVTRSTAGRALTDAKQAHGQAAHTSNGRTPQ
jgi:hypothetical protein